MASKGLTFRISADMKQFKTAMQNAQTTMQKVGKSMQKVGKSMSTYVTAPIVALGAASVIAWDKQAKAIAQVDAGLRATGGAVGYTSEQLQKMASEMQNNSLFNDEDILKNATAQLLTFTNIAGDQFKRTQMAALDLSTRLDGDLKSAAIQLGKALNDPVANLSALSRSGIQFSTEQKTVINKLVKTNKLAEAQTIILGELEKQYGGSAEAAAAAGLGPFTQMGNALGDLSEDFGKIITEALTPFVARIKGVVSWLKSLSTTTKTVILIIAGIVAAIGPVLLIIGLLLPALAAVGAAIAAINWPIVLIIAAIAALVAAGLYLYENWDVVTERLSQAWAHIKNLFIDGIIGVVKYLTFFYRYLADTLGISVFGAAVDTIVSKLEGLKSTVPETTKEFGSFTDAVLGMKKEVTAALSATDTPVETTTTKVKTLGKTIAWGEQTAIKMGTGIKAATAYAATGVEELTGSMEVLKQNTANVGEVATVMFKGYQDNIKRTLNNIVEFASYAGEVMGDLFSVIGQYMENEMARHNNDTQARINNIDRQVARDVISTADGEKRKNLIRQQAAEKGAQLKRKQFNTEKGFAIAMAAIHAALAVTQALANLAPPYSFVVAGISAGMAALQIGAIASTPPPAFADGGLVFGPTMGMVGEGIGTTRNNPEVIAPLDKLKNFIGGSGTDNISLTGKLFGEDLLISNEKAALSYANLQI